MIDRQQMITLRMERQHLVKHAGKEEYDELYRDLSPGSNLHWHGFGEPPCLVYRTDFNDVEYNRKRQMEHKLVKGRFQNGNIGFVDADEMELFACLYRKEYKPAEIPDRLLALIRREGPMNIALMKEFTGYLVKQITPALHKLQEAFILFEDQFDGEWDRGWFPFEEMFPEVDLTKYTRQEALEIVLRRFAYRYVHFNTKQARSFYGIPEKEIRRAAEALKAEGVLTVWEDGYLLSDDVERLEKGQGKPYRGMLNLHRNDFLVKCEEYHLKNEYKSEYGDVLQYLLIDGEVKGAVIGHFRYGPYEIEDIRVNLPEEEVSGRKEEILEAVYAMNDREKSPYRRFQGKEI